MASTFTVIPTGTYQPGTRAFGPTAVPVGSTFVQFTLDAPQMVSAALVVFLTVDYSLDGGVTWASVTPGPTTDPFPFTAEFHGGTVDAGNVRVDGAPTILRRGARVPLDVFDVSARLPGDPTSTLRLIRGTITVSGAPCTTTGRVTVS